MSSRVNYKPFIWPSRTPFGMTEESRLKIEAFIHSTDTAFGNPDLYKGIDETKVPFLKRIKGYYVKTDSPIIGKGAYSTVYKYYNPVSGEYVAGKVVTGKFTDIEFVYQQISGKKHCVEWLGSCREQSLIFEPLYTGDLGAELKKRTLSPSEKIQILFQVATGVDNIQSSGIRIGYQDHNINQWMNFCHRDLKLENIFVHSDAKSIRCFVGDYESIPEMENIISSPGYESPELGNAPDTEKEIVEFNLKWGQKQDIWQLGLIFAAVLNDNAPLSFLKGLSDLRRKERYSFVAKLQQGEVDGDLSTIIQKIDVATSYGKVLASAWEMVKTDMMQVDPEKRASIKSIIAKIKDIQCETLSVFDTLSLKDNPYKWPDVIPFNLLLRRSIESQITQYVSSWVQVNGALFSTGEVTESGHDHIFKHKLFYNNKNCFFNTGEKLKDTQFTKYYSPIEQKYYILKDYFVGNNDRYKNAVYLYKYYRNNEHLVQGTVLDDMGVAMEPLYSKNLSQLLLTGGLQTTAAKFDAMVQIVTGVKSIQSPKFNNGWYSNMGYNLSGSPASHRELSLTNILVKQEGDTLTFDIGGYTNILYVGDPVEKSLTSPEAADLVSGKDRIHFIYTNGTKIDMWQLGLLCSHILQNSTKPLTPFVDGFQIQNVKQSDIDLAIYTEIAAIAENNALPDEEKSQLIKAWNTVNQLLQIDPKRRWTLDELIETWSFLRVADEKKAHDLSLNLPRLKAKDSCFIASGNPDSSTSF